MYCCLYCTLNPHGIRTYQVSHATTVRLPKRFVSLFLNGKNKLFNSRGAIHVFHNSRKHSFLFDCKIVFKHTDNGDTYIC